MRNHQDLYDELKSLEKDFEAGLLTPDEFTDELFSRPDQVLWFASLCYTPDQVRENMHRALAHRQRESEVLALKQSQAAHATSVRVSRALTIEDLIAIFEDLGIPPSHGRDRVKAILSEEGHSTSNARLSAAIKEYRARSSEDDDY